MVNASGIPTLVSMLVSVPILERGCRNSACFVAADEDPLESSSMVGKVSDFRLIRLKADFNLTRCFCTKFDSSNSASEREKLEAKTGLSSKSVEDMEAR